MAGICNAASRKSHPTDGHRVLSVLLDGETITHEVFDADFDAVDWNGELPEAWRRLTPKQLFALLGLKRMRQAGIQIDDFLNRVTNGDEATNVKQYDFIGPGAVVTKTNIGTSYVDVLPGANGQRVLVDFTGCTQFRLIGNVNHVTASGGQLQLRIVRDSDNAVLYESPLLSAAAGEKELDSGADAQAVDGWLTLPAAASGLSLARYQARSTVAADDPQFRRLTLWVR